MRVTGLALQHIRAHRHYTLLFETPTTVIVGPNASGKTTIIEGLYLLATGESFRAQKIEEVIGFGEELGRVKGKVLHGAELADEAEVGSIPEEDLESILGVGEEGAAEASAAPESTELEVILTRGEVQGKRTAHRLFSVNGVRRRKADAMKNMQAVVFRPEDMRLIEGSPARRRSFLDAPLLSLHQEYARAHKTYEQTLRRRNKLLQQVREGEQPRTTLQYWNLSLVKHGEILQQHRREFLGQCAQVDFPLPFAVNYEPSVISQARQQEYLPREIAAGHSLIGPHKDDFFVTLPIAGEPRNISLFGSRGQQRLAVLWLKFCELAYTTKKSGERPLLLLDDILSELDDQSRELSLTVAKQYQTVITTTEEEVISLLEEHLDPGTMTVVHLEKL